MRTGVVLDRLEVIALSSGGRIEVTLGENQILLIGPPGRLGCPKKEIAEEPSSQPERLRLATPLERKRRRQREWVAAKRALKTQPPAGLLTSQQVAARLGVTGKLVSHAVVHRRLKATSRVKAENPHGYAYRFKWADVVKWRAGVQTYNKAR